MQRFFSIFMAFCLALTLSLDAQAKRFGGGTSMGAAPSHQTRQVQQQRNDQALAQPAHSQPAPARSGASRWLGPLAGIAAGGLLASLFMGDGFEGFQFLDVLILAALAYLVFRLVMRRRQTRQGSQYRQPPAFAGQVPLAKEAPARPMPLSGSAGLAPVRTPAWFDEPRFLAAARSHFMALQQHWDTHDMAKIAEFVTPQMLELLRRQRQEDSSSQSTLIENLQVQLDGVDDLPEKTVATVTFSGLSKDGAAGQAEPFSESWRLERAQGQNQPWLIAGIRQN